MGLTIDLDRAKAILDMAFAQAKSNRPVPSDWEEFTRRTFAMTAKTYTVALGTALLAKATDPRVDPLSIKASYAPNSYSLRTLGHKVLVPEAERRGFSIRTTGREPLNNQPFFRYDHMTTIERVRDKEALKHFINELGKLSSLDRTQAIDALAAFLKVAIEVADGGTTYTIGDGPHSLAKILEAITKFLNPNNPDRPSRLQATVAGAFDVTHHDVRSRRLNDPSRDFPGDVQAYVDDSPILAVEVRGKPVLDTEVVAFVRNCHSKGVCRAFIVVLSPTHQALDLESLRAGALEVGVLLQIVERESDLVYQVLGWAEGELSATIEYFIAAVLNRLTEIEATEGSCSSWIQLTTT